MSITSQLLRQSLFYLDDFLYLLVKQQVQRINM